MARIEEIIVEDTAKSKLCQGGGNIRGRENWKRDTWIFLSLSM